MSDKQNFDDQQGMKRPQRMRSDQGVPSYFTPGEFKKTEAQVSDALNRLGYEGNIQPMVAEWMLDNGYEISERDERSEQLISPRMAELILTQANEGVSSAGNIFVDPDPSDYRGIGSQSYERPRGM